MLFYRAALPLPSRTLNYVSGIVRRHLASIGFLWRKLSPGQQALLVLAYPRKGETFAELAAGFGVGAATGWRYVNETVELLAARAPKLRKAVRDAKKAGYACVVLDGTLIPINRVAADRPTPRASAAGKMDSSAPPTERAGIAERRQPRSREAPRTRRKGERLAHELAVLRKLRCCPCASGNSPRQSTPHNQDEKAHYPTGRHGYESVYV